MPTLISVDQAKDPKQTGGTCISTWFATFVDSLLKRDETSSSRDLRVVFTDEIFNLAVTCLRFVSEVRHPYF